MISIVITAYNVEKYIKKCIDSALNQTYNDLEIIVVNDCSEDGTQKILSTYSDNNIKIINNKVNVGAGLSRRYGINESNGEYVLLLDADDYLANDYIETLYNAAIENNADIVSGGVTTVDENYNILKTIVKSFGVFKNDDKFTNEIDGTTVCFLNNKIIKRNLYNIVEYCDRRFIEDTPVLMKLLYYANKSVYVDNNGYYYVQRKESLMNSSNKIKKIIFEFLYLIDMYEFFKDKYNCIANKMYNFNTVFNNLYTLQLNNLNPEDFSDWKNEWNYIVTFIKNNK